MLAWCSALSSAPLGKTEECQKVLCNPPKWAGRDQIAALFRREDFCTSLTVSPSLE
jgi:hypothetical protein